MSKTIGTKNLTAKTLTAKAGSRKKPAARTAARGSSRRSKQAAASARLAARQSPLGSLFPQAIQSDEDAGDAPTARQMEIYAFIRDKIHSRGFGPTVREIGQAFKIRSPNGVVCHLKALERKGLITRGKNMSRAIELVTEPAHLRGLPMAG